MSLERYLNTTWTAPKGRAILPPEINGRLIELETNLTRHPASSKGDKIA